jgi:hypothetical protein
MPFMTVRTQFELWFWCSYSAAPAGVLICRISLAETGCQPETVMQARTLPALATRALLAALAGLGALGWHWPVWDKAYLITGR